MEDFDEIYAEYYSQVYKFVLSLCREPALAEEITQETFFKALKSIDSFKGNCKLSTWLCKIARNTFCIPLDDITVSAAVYSLAELAEEHVNRVPDSESVTIFSDENDNSETMQVKIPELGTINMTEDLIEKCRYATVISVGSEYILRTVESEIKDNTVYITSFKTTLLNNKDISYQKQSYSLELQEINRIVFVESDGTETVLWSR